MIPLQNHQFLFYIYRNSLRIKIPALISFCYRSFCLLLFSHSTCFLKLSYDLWLWAYLQSLETINHLCFWGLTGRRSKSHGQVGMGNGWDRSHRWLIFYWRPSLVTHSIPLPPPAIQEPTSSWDSHPIWSSLIQEPISPWDRHPIWPLVAVPIPAKLSLNLLTLTIHAPLPSKTSFFQAEYSKILQSFLMSWLSNFWSFTSGLFFFFFF